MFYIICYTENGHTVNGGISRLNILSIRLLYTTLCNRDNDSGERDNSDNRDSSDNRDNDSEERDNSSDVVRDQVTTFISLPSSIQFELSTINPQNNDRQCFKCSVLAKHVTGRNRCRIDDNYLRHAQKYDFTGLSFPTPLCEVKIFERKNPTVSVNVYGLEKKTNHRLKSVSYIVFPLKVDDEEKVDHFDLLFILRRTKMVTIYLLITFRDLFVRNHRSIRIVGCSVNGVLPHLIVENQNIRRMDKQDLTNI